MSTLLRDIPDLPPEQQAIRAKCFHPTGTFVEFNKEEIEQSIADRFEEQVRRYPDRLAVKTEKEELTYEELNNAANRVARAILAQRGVGEEPVALLFEHGAPMFAALLGVLKAGKFYVPLDPSYPRARVSYILQDSRADLIVTNHRNLSLAMMAGAERGDIEDMVLWDPIVDGSAYLDEMAALHQDLASLPQKKSILDLIEEGDGVLGFPFTDSMLSERRTANCL